MGKLNHTAESQRGAIGAKVRRGGRKRETKKRGESTEAKLRIAAGHTCKN